MLLLCAVVGAKAAVVTDLKTISSDFTFIADVITENGTKALTANTLYLGDSIFTSTGNTVATNKGSSTINGVSHLNSLRIKNTQDQLAFKVSKACEVTFYTQSHASRGLQVGSSEGGTQFGTQPVNTSSWTVKITEGATVYLSSYSGDFYIAGFTVQMKTATSLSFAETSGSADIIDGTSYTLPELTKSPETLTVAYSSSNSDVATVDASTGAVTLVSVGKTTITASFAGDATYYSSSATFELTVTNSAASEIDVTYDISGIVGIAGIAPDNFTITEGATFVIPTNQTLYVEGKTLTGWSDGSNTYAIGETVTAPGSDMNLTPVFTDNTVSLADRDNALTLTFDFQKKNGAPSVAWEGRSNLAWVTQATISGKTIDVAALFSTNPGKFSNKNWDDWCQINKETIFTIPSEKNTVITIEAFNVLGEGDGKQLLTIDGNTDYAHEKVSTYTVSSSTSTIDIVFGEEGSYYRYIKVALPAPPMPVVTNKTWNLSTFDAQTFASTKRIDELEFASGVVIDGSNKSYGSEFTGSKRAKTGSAGSKTSRYLHFRVAGNSKITVYAMSGNSSNQRNIIIDANGTELLKKKLTGDVLNKVETLYLGDEQDIYLYSDEGGINIHGIKVEAIPASISKTITAAGYATYCSPYPLNFAGVEGLTAYIAAKDGTKVKFTPVDNVPAGTGVLLKGAEGDYSIPVIASSTTDVENNILTGVLANTPIEIGDYGYVLMNVSNVVGFYKTDTTKGFTVGANTAYIKSDKGLSRMFIGFDDDEVETTGISATLNENGKMINDKFIYNLNGQRVKNASKGLFIKNGKKFVVK